MAGTATHAMRNKTARFLESQNTNTNLAGAISDSQWGRIPPELQSAESYPRQTIRSTSDPIFSFGLDSDIQKREGFEPGQALRRREAGPVRWVVSRNH